MGYMAHHAVLVHDWQSGNGNSERVAAFRDGLPEKWAALVIGPVQTVVNGSKTYAFLPDGSKEGWFDSDEGDRLRDEFVALFANTYAEVVVVRFGGDEPERAEVRIRPAESED